MQFRCVTAYDRSNVDRTYFNGMPDIGNASRDIGNAFRDIGNASRDIGNASRDIGNAFRDIGNASRDIGNASRDIGNAFRDIGNAGIAGELFSYRQDSQSGKPQRRRGRKGTTLFARFAVVAPNSLPVPFLEVWICLWHRSSAVRRFGWDRP